jgi:hypothetical protein
MVAKALENNANHHQEARQTHMIDQMVPHEPVNSRLGTPKKHRNPSTMSIQVDPTIKPLADQNHI